MRSGRWIWSKCLVCPLWGAPYMLFVEPKSKLEDKLIVDLHVRTVLLLNNVENLTNLSYSGYSDDFGTSFSVGFHCSLGWPPWPRSGLLYFSFLLLNSRGDSRRI